jgi:hypothetical protein
VNGNGADGADLSEAQIMRMIMPTESPERETVQGFDQWRTTRHDFVPAPHMCATKYGLLTPRRKTVHDLWRMTSHVNMTFQETPMSTAVAQLVKRRMDNNSRKKKPTTRAGVAVNGDGGQGKSETVLEISAGFADTWLMMNRYAPEVVAGTRDVCVPVVYVQTPVTAKPISTCKAILAFFDAPTGSRWTLPDYLRAVRDSLRDHRVQVLILDDITRLNMGRVDDQDTLDMIRSLMSMNVTLIMIGVDILGKGLLRGGKYDPSDRRYVFAPLPKNKIYLNDDPAATQTDRRFDLINLNPFGYTTDAQIIAWYQHLVGIEEQIRLFNAPRTGLLTTGSMPEYLFKRTGGVVGMLERLIEDACHLAISNGTETLTESLLEEIDPDMGDDPRRDPDAGEVPAVPEARAKPTTEKKPQKKIKNGSFDDKGTTADLAQPIGA